jgi:hypothetical protein
MDIRLTDIVDNSGPAVVMVKNLIADGLSSDEIWTELKKIGFNRQSLGPNFIKTIREGEFQG